MEHEKNALDLSKLPLPQQFEYVSRSNNLEKKSRATLIEEYRFWMYYYYIQTEKVKDLITERMGLGEIRAQHLQNNMLKEKKD